MAEKRMAQWKQEYLTRVHHLSSSALLVEVCDWAERVDDRDCDKKLQWKYVTARSELDERL